MFKNWLAGRRLISVFAISVVPISRESVQKMPARPHRYGSSNTSFITFTVQLRGAGPSACTLLSALLHPLCSPSQNYYLHLADKETEMQVPRLTWPVSGRARTGQLSQGS